MTRGFVLSNGTNLYSLDYAIHFLSQKRHPKDIGGMEIDAFLNHLAINRNCSISTQKIVLNALMFLFRRHLNYTIDNLQFKPARTHRRLPVVYSREEIRLILPQLEGMARLMVEVMYGSGLRSAELLSLRIERSRL